MIHQTVGQRIHITLRDGVKQQQLQHLMVGKAVESALQEFRPGPLAVANVDAALSLYRHDLASLLYIWGKYSIFPARRQEISRQAGQNRPCGIAPHGLFSKQFHKV